MASSIVAFGKCFISLTLGVFGHTVGFLVLKTIPLWMKSPEEPGKSCEVAVGSSGPSSGSQIYTL